MYVRDARKNEEEWLLQTLEDNSLDWSSFRSREFTFVCSEDSDNVLAFGRLRKNKLESGNVWFEITSVHVTDDGKQVRAESNLIDSFIDDLSTMGVSNVYTITTNTQQFQNIGFEEVDRNRLSDVLLERVNEKEQFLNIPEGNATVMKIEVDSFTSDSSVSEDEVNSEKEAQGFGDSDENTHKYSV